MHSTSLFERGDKVRRKTGGPVMTVEHCGDHAVYCIWYVGKETHSANFSRKELDLVLRREDVPDSGPAPLE
jgi:uncharacterized protein YodC (DUF2158 family)